MTDDRFRPDHARPDDNTDAFPHQSTDHFGAYPNTQGPAQGNAQSQQGGQVPPGGHYQQPGSYSPQSGQYPHPGNSGYGTPYGSGPSAQSAPSGPSGQYPAPYHQGQYPYQQQPRGKGRMIALIAILLTLILVLVGLGVWWWTSKSGNGENAPGADNADQALEMFVDRFNSGDMVSMKDSVAPSEKQYLSAVSTLALRSNWSSIDVGDQDELVEQISENADKLQESMEFNLTVNETSSVGLGPGMESRVITDGDILIDITDDQKFAQTMEEIFTENLTEEQLRDFEAEVLSGQYDSMEEAFLDMASEFPIEENLSQASLPLVFVEEEAGWYMSPMATIAASSNIDFFTDESLRADVERRVGEFSMPAPEHFDSPEAAANAFFTDALAGRVTDLPKYLPLAEARPLALAMYLNSTTPLGSVSIAELLQFSDVAFSSIAVSEHSSIAAIETVTITLNPMMTGTGGQIRIADGELQIPGCRPVDISVLQDPEHPLLAVGTIQDETGWSVSLGATFANISGAVGSEPENLAELQRLGDELGQCF